MKDYIEFKGDVHGSDDAYAAGHVRWRVRLTRPICERIRTMAGMILAMKTLDLFSVTTMNELMTRYALAVTSGGGKNVYLECLELVVYPDSFVWNWMLDDPFNTRVETDLIDIERLETLMKRRGWL
jgi:hypothetical protein